jgi:hypothetical protein
MGKQRYDVVYICDWLPPDFGAVGQYSELFARQMAERGERVALLGLTSGSRSDQGESVGCGFLRIVKTPAKRFDRSDRRARLLWTIKTNTRLLREAWPLIRRARKVMFTGSPPLFLHWIAPANLILRKELIYRITDFHPECAIAERGCTSVMLRMIYALTLFWRRRVTRFEVLGHDQAVRLQEIGVPPARIRLKPDLSPAIITPQTAPLPRPISSDDQVLLLYSGNWGVAHDYQTFLEAYRRHHRQGRANVLLWLNAIGSGAAKVEAALEAADLPFIRGRPVPLDQLASLLVTPDAHLITLSDPFVGYVLPSKVHGCIASSRPILFIGSERSDVHRLSAEGARGGYQRVDVGDAEGCARALDSLGRAAGAAKRRIARAATFAAGRVAGELQSSQ